LQNIKSVGRKRIMICLWSCSHDIFLKHENDNI
jgi:hypothetical protein